MTPAFLAALFTAITALAVGPSQSSVIVVEARVQPQHVKVGQPIPLTVVIKNHFTSAFLVPCLSLIPSAKNEETIGISLVAVDPLPEN